MKQWYEELYEDYQAFDDEPLAQSTALEVDFIEQFIDHDRSHRILDVACGSGRHTLELSRRGYTVVGVDLSDSMLQRGRRVADAESLKVDFFQRDARRLKIYEQFDLVIMLYEAAFSLMEQDEMDRAILENVCLALNPRGKLIMTAPNAVFKLTQQLDGSFNPVTFRETFKMEKKISGGRNKMLDCTQRYYTCPELNWLLKQVGFKNVQFFACTKAGYSLDTRPHEKHFELGAIASK